MAKYKVELNSIDEIEFISDEAIPIMDPGDTVKNLRWENTGGNVYIFYGTVRELGFCIDLYGDGAWYPHDYDESLNWEGDDYTGGMDDKMLRYLTSKESFELLSEIVKADIPKFFKDAINTTLEEMK